VISSVALLAAVTLERLGELWLARRNASALTASGAFEVSGAQYPAIVMMHSAWLIGLWIWAWNAPIDVAWIAVFAALQLLRL
jgi:methyltransferase